MSRRILLWLFAPLAAAQSGLPSAFTCGSSDPKVCEDIARQKLAIGAGGASPPPSAEEVAKTKQAFAALYDLLYAFDNLRWSPADVEIAREASRALRYLRRKEGAQAGGAL